MRSHAFKAKVLSWAALALALASCDRGASPPRPPNILLVSIDTLSAKHVSAYGYPHDTTPFLAGIAREGVLFDYCVAAATHTLESHMTMMTSLPPAEHGVHDFGQALDPSVPTLAETLRAAGFRTAAFTEDGWVSGGFGFARGFDVFHENRSADAGIPEGQVAATFAQGIDWLTQQGDSRWFLFLHTYQVHGPYTPPEQYRTFFHERVGDEGRQELRAAEDDRIRYDEEVRYVDEQLRELWRRVLELGHGDDTVLVITSDHGEAFLEHGWVQHGSYMYDEVARVPLIVRGPGIAADRRVREVVGLADLLPTLAELAGAAVPSGIRGTSLLRLLRANMPPVMWENRAVVSETWSHFAEKPGMIRFPFPSPAFAAVLWPLKLARYPSSDGDARYELYDLAADPGETRDLWSTRGAEASAMKSLLDGWEAAGVAAKATRLLAAHSNGAGTATVANDAAREDPAVREKLRVLGYAD